MPNTTGDDDGPDELRPVPFPAFLMFEAGLAPLALALGWALGAPPLETFAWDAGAAGRGVVASLPMLAFFAASVRWPVGPLGRIKAFVEAELAPVLQGCRWPDLALLSAAAGVGEEMLFRGVIQAALARLLGPAGGLAASALVFGLMHPVSPAYVVIAGALGAYLGGVWLLTGNLLSVMTAHALYDFVALAVLVRARPDRAGG